MLLKGNRVNEDIVQVGLGKGREAIVMKDSLHIGLEPSWGVDETEWAAGVAPARRGAIAAISGVIGRAWLSKGCRTGPPPEGGKVLQFLGEKEV